MTTRIMHETSAQADTHNSKTAADFNAPQTENIMINEAGYRLHIRSSQLPISQCRAVMYYVHGYGAHVNRPEVIKMIRYMNERGVCVLCFDQQGHGYSEGIRALVEHHDHLVRDLLQFVSFFSIQDTPATQERFILDSLLTPSYLDGLRNLPFFITGASMGGAVAALASLSLRQCERFVGMALLAPALRFTLPNCLVKNILKYTIGMLYPAAQMPASATAVTNNSYIWSDPEVLLYAELDTYGKPGALGYNVGMRYGTACMFMELQSALDAHLADITSPFLIIHDPDDKICIYDGSVNMMEVTSTAVKNKEIAQVPGWLHGLLGNKNTEICDMIIAFMEPRYTNMQQACGSNI